MLISVCVFLSLYFLSTATAWGELWHYRSPCTHDWGTNSILIADEYLFDGLGDTLAAFNASTGEPIFTFNVNAQSVQLAYEYGILFVFEYASTVYALEPSTGAVRWKQTIGTSTYENANMAVGEGVVIASGEDGQVFIFDAKNGTKIGYHKFSSFSYTQTIVSHGIVFGVNNNPVPTLWAISLSAPNASLLWSTSAPNYSPGSPLLAASPGGTPPVIIIMTTVDAVVAMDGRNGKGLWLYGLNQSLYGFGPSLSADDALLFLPATPSVIAVDARSGQQVWISTIPGQAAANWPYTHLSPHGSVVVWSGQRIAYGLDTYTGNLLWNVTSGGNSPEGAALYSPYIEAGVAYFYWVEASLQAIDLFTGEGVAPSVSVIGYEPMAAMVGGAGVVATSVCGINHHHLRVYGVINRTSTETARELGE